jgi:hypothetical protein
MVRMLLEKESERRGRSQCSKQKGYSAIAEANEEGEASTRTPMRRPKRRQEFILPVGKFPIYIEVHTSQDGYHALHVRVLLGHIPPYSYSLDY